MLCRRPAVRGLAVREGQGRGLQHLPLLRRRRQQWCAGYAIMQMARTYTVSSIALIAPDSIILHSVKAQLPAFQPMSRLSSEQVLSRLGLRSSRIVMGLASCCPCSCNLSPAPKPCCRPCHSRDSCCNHLLLTINMSLCPNLTSIPSASACHPALATAAIAVHTHSPAPRHRCMGLPSCCADDRYAADRYTYALQPSPGAWLDPVPNKMPMPFPISSSPRHTASADGQLQHIPPDPAGS